MKMKSRELSIVDALGDVLSRHRLTCLACKDNSFCNYATNVSQRLAQWQAKVKAMDDAASLPAND